MADNGHVIQKAEFNRIAPATSAALIQPPEEVTAEVTGPTQITLTWTPVPGATAYRIGRAVPPGGLRTICNGVGAGDLIKTGLYPAGLEWNKASWNVIDQRTWRQTFGPYPTDPSIRERDWYDDLRPAMPRPAMMAPAISMFTWPGLTVKPTDGETRQSRALQAPTGTSLDDTDVSFCRSGAFGSTGWFVGKASWGICK